MNEYSYNILEQSEPDQDGYVKVTFEMVVDGVVRNIQRLAIQEDRVNEDLIQWVQFVYG